MGPDLTRQDVPETRCPDCGAEPTDESVARHALSDCGYLHDDVVFECSDCDADWTHGVPIGEGTDLADDLHCPVCEEAYMRVHRVDVTSVIAPNAEDVIGLHLKCPACYYFAETERRPDDSQVALVGYPDITGNMDEAEAWAYRRD